MPRIRSVKPDMRDSVNLARCCIPARWFFVILLTEMDDRGRVAYTPKKLAGILFPHDEDVEGSQIRAWVSELCENGMLVEYEHGGRRFLCAPNFRKHQVINKPSPSYLPDPYDSTILKGSLPESPPAKEQAKPDTPKRVRKPKPVEAVLPDAPPIPDAERAKLKARLESTFDKTASARRMK